MIARLNHTNPFTVDTSVYWLIGWRKFDNIKTRIFKRLLKPFLLLLLAFEVIDLNWVFDLRKVIDCSSTILNIILNGIDVVRAQTCNRAATLDAHNSSYFYVSQVLQRQLDMKLRNSNFLRRCDEECRRSCAHLQLTTGCKQSINNLLELLWLIFITGTLTITPMQAYNLPEMKRNLNLSVKMTYGEQVHTTFSISPTADLSWLYT